MIFFVGNDGTIIDSVPSPVYQGAAGANNIYLVAPFAENLQASVAFKLPNGVWTNRYPFTMTREGTIAELVNEKTGKSYAVWQCSIPNEATQYYGEVTAQFFFYAANDGVIIASSSTSFTVGRGVPAVLPDTPTDDVYDKVLSIISSMQSDLSNGFFTARAIYAWNAKYSYGANELVFYPDKGAYGTFLKSLVTNNENLPYDEQGTLNIEYWEEIIDFNILNSLYERTAAVEQAALSAQESAKAAGEYAYAADTSAQNAAISEKNAESAAQSVQEPLQLIKDVIPSTASAENQLVDTAKLNSSINAMAAFYITSNEQGDAFSTKADLLAATTFYSGGQTRIPTQNDYAIVLADESQPQGADGKYPTTRYSYQGGTYPDGQWDFQYVVNNTSLTQAQVDAINSGITKELVEQIGEESFDPNGTYPNVSVGTATKVLNSPPPAVGLHHRQFSGEPTPASIWAGTTWEIDTDYQGRTIIGSGGNYSLGNTGGNETAAHIHSAGNLYAMIIPKDYDKLVIRYHAVESWDSQITISGVSRTDAATKNLDAATSIRGSVGETSVNVMQPYAVVNIWKRTA